MSDEQNIPIDIHHNKLLDWLISRRHVKKDWSKTCLLIRQKISNAIQDMPENEEIACLLAGSYINYFHCCRIVEILKETEASSKNIFGKYSSQRMKDWLEVIRLYENDNVYLADASQMLMRNISYEIPCLKKQLSKCAQVQEECLRKKSDYAKNAAKMKEKYFSSCKQIGIKGENIRKELMSLLDELPETFSNIAVLLKNVTAARMYYKCFLSFTLNRNFDDNECLPIIHYLIEKGNTSTYEWRTGEVPDVVELTKPVLPLDVDNGSTELADDQIDFGDFCLPSESSEDRSSSTPNGDFVHIEKEDCKAESSEQINFGDVDINWDISVESPGISIVDEKDNKDGKVATGEDALSLLENPITRNLFHNELLELEGFLEQRLKEISPDNPWYASSDVLCSGHFFSAPPEVQLQSESSIRSMLNVVKDIASQLMSVKLKHLYLIKESGKYVDRLTLSLKSISDTSEKLLLSKQAVEVKYDDGVEQQKLFEPKIQLIIQKTKELQSQIEAEISKKYKNRPVNITGTALSR